MKELSSITVTALLDANTVRSAKGHRWENPCRKSFALSFCAEGRITYTHKGQEYISHRNQAVILPKGGAYSLYGNEAGSFPLINFQCDGLPEDTFFLIPLSNPESYLKDFEQLKYHLLFPNNRARAMSIFYEILHRLSQEGSAIHPALLPALQCLEKDFSQPTLHNAFLADLCGISEVYFRQLFHASFGTSPRQYILQLRLQKARQLLSGSDLPINTIAEACGFTNPYHFSRCFHTATGQTPTEFRILSRRIMLL